MAEAVTPQPKALELADAMDGQTLAHVKHGVLIGFVPNARCMLAATELRRQNAEIADLQAQLERKSDAIQRLWSERDSLRAEVERLRADAERYRWLRQDLPWGECAYIFDLYHTEELDAAIDAAREAK